MTKLKFPSIDIFAQAKMSNAGKEMQQNNLSVNLAIGFDQ